MVTVIALVTLLTRALPFLIFPENKQPPKIITYLSRVLPCAVMGMLVVYCLKSISFITSPYGAPEIIASAIVIISYLLKRNTLLSILLGTIVYMILIQFLFI